MSDDFDKEYEPDCDCWEIDEDFGYWISREVTGYSRSIPPGEERDIWHCYDSKCPLCGKKSKEADDER